MRIQKQGGQQPLPGAGKKNIGNGRFTHYAYNETQNAYMSSLNQRSNGSNRSFAPFGFADAMESEERAVCGKASRKNNLSNYSAGILAAGKALARRISARICNERATPPAVKRTSQNAQVIFSRCRSPDFKQALLERLHGENQMNKEKWTKLWYDRFEVYDRSKAVFEYFGLPYEADRPPDPRVR
jgi:hypothetical protein